MFIAMLLVVVQQNPVGLIPFDAAGNRGFVSVGSAYLKLGILSDEKTYGPSAVSNPNPDGAQVFVDGNNTNWPADPKANLAQLGAPGGNHAYSRFQGSANLLSTANVASTHTGVPAHVASEAKAALVTPVWYFGYRPMSCEARAKAGTTGPGMSDLLRNAFVSSITLTASVPPAQ